MEALVYHLRENRATLHLGETVSSVEAYHDDHGDHVRLHLASGKQVVTDKAAVQRRPSRRDRSAGSRGGRVDARTIAGGFG